MHHSSPLFILVVGASGSIGRQVIDAALELGHRVRALVRRADQLEPRAGQEIMVGHLTIRHSVLPAVVGVDAVVFAHGTYGSREEAEAVDYGGVRNVLAGLGNRSARIALMTTIAVTDRKGAHDWKRRAERLLRASGQPYTIVRPGWFDENEPGQWRIVCLQGDRRQSGTPRDGVIASRQLARVLVRSLTSDTALRKTFELVAEPGDEQENFEALFAPLEPDKPGELDGVQDAANMTREGEPSSVLLDLAEREQGDRPA